VNSYNVQRKRNLPGAPCKTAEELIAKAKEAGFELTQADAKIFLN